MSYRRPLVTTAALIAIAIAALSGALLPYDRIAHADPPVFGTTPDPSARSIPENTPPGVNIGDPISATDGDDDGTGNDDLEYGDTLTYSLNGTDASSFDIDASTGQLITKAALDFEKPHGGTNSDSNSYVVTVTVKDGDGTSVTQNVTIGVTNVAEAPGALAAPTAVSTNSDNDATTYELKVVWHAPDDGGNGVTGYDVEYKKTTAAGFTDHDHSGTTRPPTSPDWTSTRPTTCGCGPRTMTILAILAPGRSRAWGRPTRRTTTCPRSELDSVTRNVLENAEPGLVVGAQVSATDDDNVLPLAYTLQGPDANSFDLQASTGQIRTKRGVAYDFETKPNTLCDGDRLRRAGRDRRDFGEDQPHGRARGSLSKPDAPDGPRDARETAGAST